MSLPTSVEPVKVTMSTSPCNASGLPTFSPKPGRTLRTPSGRPASGARAASRGRQGGQPDGAQRGLFGRLQHHRISGEERRADLPGRDDQRVVPGHDGGYDAERLATQKGHIPGTDRRHLVIELVGEFGVI